MPPSISIVASKPQVTILGMIRILRPARPARRDILDVRELPDHLKRDLGILDGSRPVGSVRW